MKVKIATCVIDIRQTDHPSIKRVDLEGPKQYLKGFITTVGKPFYQIVITSQIPKRLSNKDTCYLNADFTLYQLMILIRDILRRYLRDYHGFFLHCAANRINKTQAVVFLGNSRAGKSTISQLLNSKYPKIVDDLGILLLRNNRWYIYQTHLKEKNKVSKSSKGFQVNAIFHLKKSNSIRAIRQENLEENIARMYKTVFFEKRFSRRQFRNIIDTVSTIPFYSLFFPKNESELLRFFNHFSHP